jgi:hypothetical protein
VDNLMLVLIGFLALLLIILVLNVINAMVGNRQRKKVRDGLRARNHGYMDGVDDDYHGDNEHSRHQRNSPQTQHRNPSQPHHKQSTSSASRTQQVAHHSSASHSNSFSGGHSHH